MDKGFTSELLLCCLELGRIHLCVCMYVCCVCVCECVCDGEKCSNKGTEVSYIIQQSWTPMTTAQCCKIYFNRVGDSNFPKGFIIIVHKYKE